MLFLFLFLFSSLCSFILPTSRSLTDEDKNGNVDKVVEAADKLGCPSKPKSSDILKDLLELDKLQLQRVNYHQTVNFGYSVLNFFALAMGLYMFTAPMMGWIDYESPTLGTALIFGGIYNYLLGFYDGDQKYFC